MSSEKYELEELRKQNVYDNAVDVDDDDGDDDMSHDQLLGPQDQDSEALLTASPSAANELANEPSLKRQVGLLSGIAMIVGLMVGSGIFSSPGIVTSNVGSAGMSLVVWGFAGFLAMLGALCYAELGTMIQKSGGEYPYFCEAFGEEKWLSYIPFLFSWTMALVTKPSTQSIIAFVFAEYVLRLFYPEGLTPVWLIKLLASFSIVVVCAINSISVTLATRVQSLFTCAKLIIIAILVIAGFVQLGKHPDQSSLHDGFANTTVNIGEWGLALVAGLWGYDGWNNLNYLTEELVNPTRNLPLAIVIGLPLVIVCYLLVNVAYFSVLSTAVVSTTDTVAMDLGDAVMGQAGAVIIPIFVAVSAFGALNGAAFTGARVVYASARDGVFPSLFAKVHPSRHSPYTALISQAVVAVLLLLPGDFSTLINYFSFAAWIFYFLAAVALLHLRRVQPKRHRPFKVWLIVPIIFIIISSYLIINPLVQAPIGSSVCLIFILLGLPVWYWRVKLGRPYQEVFLCCRKG